MIFYIFKNYVFFINFFNYTNNYTSLNLLIMKHINNFKIMFFKKREF